MPRNIFPKKDLKCNVAQHLFREDFEAIEIYANKPKLQYSYTEDRIEVMHHSVTIVKTNVYLILSIPTGAESTAMRNVMLLPPKVAFSCKNLTGILSPLFYHPVKLETWQPN